MHALEHLAAPTDPIAEPSFDAPLTTMRERCVRLIADTLVLHISEVEPADPSSRAAEIGHALSLVGRALELLDVMAVLFGEAPGSEEITASIPFEDEPGEVPDEDAARELRAEEIVASARFVLRYHHRRLTSPTAASPSRRVTAAREALRSIAARFTLLERVLLDGELAAVRVDSPEHTADELAQLRRRYVAFHRVVSPHRAPSGDELSSRLRMIALGIVRLLGDTGRLRIPSEDRAMLMVARNVVRDWLRRGGDPEERTSSGRRLFQRLRDLANRLVHDNEVQIALITGQRRSDVPIASMRRPTAWPSNDTLPSFGAILAS